ncbi:MAG: hypothetical protein ABJE47_15375 [bacterium]
MERSFASMVDVTSGAEARPRVIRETQRFGRIVIVGGGCYGSYYVRQLGRAAAAGAAEWAELVVVDRNPECRVAQLPPEERPLGLVVTIASWEEYFGSLLADAALHRTETRDDAIVPSPLMPHLMAQWLFARAAQRWPLRRVSVEPLSSAPAIPWQRAGDDGTHYVSFAEWMCPINCIEPPRCPATKGERTWSMPPALASYVATERQAGRALEGPLVFHCSHRTHGVGMIDVRDVVAADEVIARAAEHTPAAFLVGTASHCHGALQRIVVGL